MADDGSRPAAYADFIKVWFSKDQFTIEFSKSTEKPDRTRPAGQVVLLPLVAVRFAALMLHQVKQYERRHGPVEERRIEVARAVPAEKH